MKLLMMCADDVLTDVKHIKKVCCMPRVALYAIYEQTADLSLYTWYIYIFFFLLYIYFIYIYIYIYIQYMKNEQILTVCV